MHQKRIEVLHLFRWSTHTYTNAEFKHTNLTYSNFTHTHKRGILRGRRGTNSHLPSFCLAGVAQIAQSHIHLRFAWQAWHNLTSTFVSRAGCHSWHSTAHPSSFDVQMWYKGGPKVKNRVSFRISFMRGQKNTEEVNKQGGGSKKTRAPYSVSKNYIFRHQKRTQNWPVVPACLGHENLSLSVLLAMRSFFPSNAR